MTCSPDDPDTLDEVGECFLDAETEEERHVCDNLAAASGLEYLAEGWGRIGYAMSDDCVVKFPKSKILSDSESAHGPRQQRLEIETWINADDELEPLLTDIDDWDPDRHSWLTMPRASLDHGAEPERRGGDMYEMKKRVREKGYYCGDIHSQNIGRRDGNLEIIDFGHGCSPRDD